MPNAPGDIIPKIAAALEQGPANISKLSKRATINRLTVSSYLRAMEKAGFVRHKKEGRETIYMLRENPNSNFDLPIEEEDKKTFNTYYAYITQFCKECFNKEPSRTQVYKIMWDLNKDLKLNLPIGWYMYGPCAVQIYRGNEQKAFELQPPKLAKVKAKTEEYCALEPIDLQRRIYEQEDNLLYKAKEKLLNHKDRNEMNEALMEIIKHVAPETVDVMTDFARAALLVGWERARLTWTKVWKYITRIEFKETSYIKNYYQTIDEDLQKTIDYWKREAQIEIRDLVLHHINSG